MLKSGQVWAGVIVTLDATGALATPSVGPAAALYVNGTANGASVTVTGANPYKWSVTLPALTAGDCLSMYVTATISAIATGAVVAEDVGDTARISDIETDTADIQTRIPAALIAGRIDAALSAAGLATDAGEEIADAVRSELAVELAHLDADVSTAGGGLTAQETRDAMKLAPTAGAAAAGSVDAHLDAIQAQTDTIDDIKAVTDALDVSAVTQVAASSAGHLTITIGLTFDEVVTGLTIPADWVTALWTLKNNARDADTAALVQLRATNPAAGGDGLQRLNGAVLMAPITAADGELAVTQATGRIDVYLTDEMTAMLGAATAIGWDVKFIDADGDSSGQRGTADVVLTETKSTA